MKMLWVIFYYLDPGSGSLFLQLLIATLVGAGFLINCFWGRIIKFLKPKGQNHNMEEDEEQ